MNKYVNKYIVIILSFYAFWILGIPFIFSKVIPVVCANISANSKYEIEISKPKLRLSIIPTAKLRADTLKFKFKHSEDFTYIEKPEIKLRLLPLLSGKIHINRICAEKLILSAELNNKFELDKDFFEKLQNTNAKCNSLKLNRFEIALKGKDGTNALYSGENLVFKKNNRYIKINLNSNINVQNSKSSAKINLYLPKNNDTNKSIINIDINNLNLEYIGEFFKQYLPNDFISMNGIIDLKANKNTLDALFENCFIKMADSAKSIYFPKKLNINSNFNMTSKTITLNSLEVNSDNIHTFISGTISNYLDTPITTINLNLLLNKSRVEDIINLLPPIIVEEFNVHKLKHYKFFGDAIGNLTIKGNINEPDINGNIFIDNGVLIEPIKNAKGAVIKLKFTGKYVNFDVNVPAGKIEKVWVKGGVELYNVKYADMHIWSTPKVDLAIAESKVIPLHEILNFVIGPVPIMDVIGDGNIDITVKGNRKNPHIWGVLNLNNVTTHFNEIPDMVLANAEATLDFNDQNAVFTTKKGLVNNTPISIKGNCNLYGKFDFDVSSSNQELNYLYNALETSTMIAELKAMLPKLDICEGLANLNLKVYGVLKDVKDINFNHNLFTKGEIVFLDNTFGIQGIKIHNTTGKVNFDGTNALADIKSFIGTSPLNAKASIKNNTCDVKIDIPKLNLNDIAPIYNDIQKDTCNILLSIVGNYKGKIDNIEYDKVNLTAKILGTTQENKLKLSNGLIKLNNDKLQISNLSGHIENADNNFNINISADKISTTKPKVNGSIQLKSFELAVLNKFLKYSAIPKDLRNIEFTRGKVNLNCKINNSKVNLYTDLGGFSFIYTPLEMPIQIVNGSFIVRNNNLRFNKVNLLADNMPLIIDGNINEKQDFDLYINSKPKQEFIDKYINRNRIYPVKIKGDIVYTIRLKGEKDHFDVKSIVNLSPDSSIYYLGASVGDIENAIVLNFEAKIIKQYLIKIKEFSHEKIITSQSGRDTKLNMLKAYGEVELLKDDLAFHDLHILTQNPTDAKIFNIIFRKPNIKQGQFTSDLKLNGKLSNPRVIGNFHIFETNIPFLDTTMKNITFVFKEKSIELTSKGEVMGNDITIYSILKNKLTPPYYVEKAELKTKVLDLNNIINKLKLSQADNSSPLGTIENFDITTAVIKNLYMKADSIILRNLTAENISAEASLNEKKILDIKDFEFNIANGILKGDFKYNFGNNASEINIKAKNIDANAISYALFDLNNQIYGDLTGDVKLSCNGSDFENCMKTLNGNTTFNVSEGRLPKLGSLEYLLKAGNLIKGGITGLSINSVIDIITPLKTGNFSNIYGKIEIKDGTAHNIEIKTRGKDLSLFIAGNYNFSTAEAEMEVLGFLSKKISTMFGPIGNMSLNTLFNVIPGIDLSNNSSLIAKINKIPGIELSNKAIRKFIAEIKGNINGEDYVTSFKWIN